jgi:hypothetical protein
MNKLEKIIRPIVEGQIRGFIKEHPSILDGVTWYKPRRDRATTLINSLAKRIIRDLACPLTRARLEAALLEFSTGTPLPDAAGTITGASTAELARSSGAVEAGVGTPTDPGARHVNAY